MTVSELSEDFNVAEETIRRDLNELHKQGQIQKIHGGAECLNHNIECSMDKRFYLNTPAKEIIAQKALRCIKPYMRLFIDFGSTTLAFSEALKSVDNLEIYTNSPLLAKTINKTNHTHKVYLLGGLYQAHLHQNIGYMTINSIQDIFVDACVISTAAIDLEKGFFNINEDEAQIAKAMVKHSKKCIMLADVSKLNRQGKIRTCYFSDIDFLIGDEYNSEIETLCDTFGIEYL